MVIRSGRPGAGAFPRRMSTKPPLEGGFALLDGAHTADSRPAQFLQLASQRVDHPDRQSAGCRQIEGVEGDWNSVHRLVRAHLVHPPGTVRADSSSPRKSPTLAAIDSISGGSSDVGVRCGIPGVQVD